MNMGSLGGINCPKWLIGVRNGALHATVKAVGLPYDLKAVCEVFNGDGCIENPWPPIAGEFSRRIGRMGSFAGVRTSILISGN